MTDEMILDRTARLSKREAAAFLGVEEHSLARWATRGLCGVVLEQIRVGGRVYFTKESLAAFQRAVDDRRRQERGEVISAVADLSGRGRERRLREERETLERMGLWGKRKA